MRPNPRRGLVKLLCIDAIEEAELGAANRSEAELNEVNLR